jgi:hypothetical protein
MQSKVNIKNVIILRGMRREFVVVYQSVIKKVWCSVFYFSQRFISFKLKTVTAVGSVETLERQ